MPKKTKTIKIHRTCFCHKEDVELVVDENNWYELPDVICSNCGQLTTVEVLE